MNLLHSETGLSVLTHNKGLYNITELGILLVALDARLVDYRLFRGGPEVH